MVLPEVFHWLQNTAFAVGMRQSDIWFPLIEGTHILALSLSVGLILMLDLRLLRVSFQSVPVLRIMNSVMPWALPGFTVMFLTGALLFVAQAEKAWLNSFFQAKLILLFLLGLNALFFQKKFYPFLSQWETSGEVPFGARVVAILSLVMWGTVIACGRLMAYEL